MLSVILANSVELAPNCEPFEITLSYNNQPHDYWILRGEYAGAYGLLSNDEFIWLRSWREAYAEDSSIEPFPASWEEIEALVNERRAASTELTGV